MSHHHLSRDERVSLAALLRAGHTQSKCARILGVHRSTISRERKRSGTEYKAIAANKQAIRLRKESKREKRKIENDKNLALCITRLLKKGRSPEQISKELGMASDDAIYAWIERSQKDLAVLLPQRGRVRHKYGKDTGEVQGWTKLVRSIETRPKVVEERSRVGDWEGDTIVGRDRARLLVHVDRKSRFIVARIMPNGNADTTHAMTVLSLSGLPCHTITYDRGSEFALWRLIERDMRTTIYFAHAHHPWERGTSENSNGLLRRFFPKGTPLGEKIQKDINKTVRLINHRPRKCLGWKAPCQVFGHCCNSS
ncbi:MAG: IS30 family transposase [Candidatus Micrarchaeota archaeon]|nr:IS30 family transposase [Candidatus Micrarchaeota archaeon]